jgi:hypothetical protein
MKWLVKIEEKPQMRILVEFKPLTEELVFTGLYHAITGVGQNSWIPFAEQRTKMNVDLENIQELLFSTFEIMDNRLKVYEDLNKSFEIIKLIEIPGTVNDQNLMP